MSSVAPSDLEPLVTAVGISEKRGVVGGLWQFDVVARVGGRIVAEGVVVLSEAGLNH